MKLVDVHCHIYHEMFKDSFDEVLERAKSAGVKRILLSGVNPEGNIKVLSYVKKHPEMLRASLGIYPIDALGIEPDGTGLPVHKGAIDLEQQFAFIRDNLSHVTAIGEIGLDFYWAEKEKTYDQQAENFRRIIRFAKEIKKPIIIHSRKAEKECIDILEEELPNREIPINNHCFSGKKNLVLRAAALGHYFSIPANVVKSQQFQMMVELVDLKQLLTETDAPWLSPYADKPSEPAYVGLSIARIAEIKKMAVEDVAAQIWQNYVRVFGEK